MKTFKMAVAAITIYLLTVCLFSVGGCDGGEGEGIKYDIKCEYFDVGALYLKEKVSFPLFEDGLDRACFNLYPKAVGGEVNVVSVTADGKNAEYALTDDGFMTVFLPQVGKKGDRASVQTEIAITLPSGDDRFSVTESGVRIGNFYPVLAHYDGDYIACGAHSFGDACFSDIADYKVELTVPSAYAVAASAYAASLDVGEAKTKYTYEIRCVRDFAFSISDKYEVKTEKWGNKLIIYCFYNDETPEKTMEAAIKALEFFSERFGKYHYDTFTVAENELNAGGIEYPLLCFLSDGMELSDRLYTVVHETAHQWWYGVVGNDQINESYLDESLAEYSTYTFFDEHPEFGISGDDIIRLAASAASVCENSLSASDKNFVPAVKMPLDGFKSEYVYVNMVYNKGLVMMKSVENLIGRKKTTAALEKYFKNNYFKVADTDAFLSSFGNAEHVLKSYLEGKTRVYP